jgi:hypothetical protein
VSPPEFSDSTFFHFDQYGIGQLSNSNTGE